MAEQLKKRTRKKAVEAATAVEPDQPNEMHLKVIKHGLMTKDYEVNDRFQKSDGSFFGAHTTAEMIEVLSRDKSVGLEARVIHATPSGFVQKNVSRETFLEASKRKALISKKGNKLREADVFATDASSAGGAGLGLIGDDYAPLLGGPFNKQLYMYDYLKMHAYAFFSYNHHPLAKFIVDTIVDFTLGKGFRVDVRGKDKDAGLVTWRAVEKANDFQRRMRHAAKNYSKYGENMLWELPNNLSKIAYDVRPGQEPPKALLPRYRLIDPSVIWDICTYPEDIERVLFYQWIAPTQYQLFTGRDKGEAVPSYKYIYQQVPADQVLHFKTNCDSNEKRGRSDLFPVLGYLKRIQDSVNYAIIGDQKRSAWAIDTSVDGSPADLQAYADSQAALGTVPPAGSEFIHSKKVERKYLANEGGAKGGGSMSFEWCLSMIAAGVVIPVSYFGTHLSGGQTRASAIVSTEPSAKKWEARQGDMKTMIEAIFERTMRRFNLHCDCEVVFPEIVTHDRTAKLKDISLALAEGLISKRRAAEMVAKELGIDSFDWEKEQDEIKKDGPVADMNLAPLTSMGKVTSGGLSGEYKAKVKDQDGV